MSSNSHKGWLVLSSGLCYQGLWRGPQGEAFWRAGEVVFNTSHSGYEEIATDPSYFQQIVVMTAPMQGNYGVDRQVWESYQFWIQGFVSTQIYTGEGAQWLQRLNEQKVPCLSDLDTREVVLRLRSTGTQWGALVEAESEQEAQARGQALIKKTQGTPENLEKDWCFRVSRKGLEKRKGQSPAGPRVAVLDFGAKENILRELQERCSEVHVFPSRTPAAEILQGKYQGVLLSNGPGDPADVQGAQKTVQELLHKLPIFGICMGHQILGLALGAQTYKMKFGHRGANHPIQDKLLKRVYMSSQNHGYAVKAETLPSDVQITQINLNDQSVAGLYSIERNCLGIQYHPESRPGPHEAAKLFDFFIQTMIQGVPFNG
jgi:carbamoyl-phosphate synthase small subunit